MREKINVATITNELAIRANHSLSTADQKLLYYLISTLDSKKQKNFHITRVKVSDLERKMFGKITKNLYHRLKDICSSIGANPITFKRTFIEDGVTKVLPEVIHWFQTMKPIQDKNGMLFLEFHFNKKVAPYLLNISERFVQLDIKDEVYPFIGKYALNLYPALKAERNKEKATNKQSKYTILSYGVDEFRAKVGLKEKQYSEFKNLRRRVIEPIIKEINEKSLYINVSCDYSKNGRRIVAVNLKIIDVETIEIAPQSTPLKESVQKIDFVPTKKHLAKLSYAQRIAYNYLIDFGVKKGIALKQIVKKVKGAEMEGFEDLFIKKAVLFFKEKATNQSAGTFVNWWTKHKVFDSNESKNEFYKIAEAVHLEKKKMDIQKLDNRMIAKGMTVLKFKEYVMKQNEKQSNEAATIQGKGTEKTKNSSDLIKKLEELAKAKAKTKK